MKWAAESIHAVVFRVPTGETPDALQPWLRMFETPPQSFQRNPSGQPPGSIATAPVGDFQVTVSAQTGRQEIILAQPPVGDQPPSPIVDVDAATSIIADYFKKLLTGDSVVRIALVLNLSKRFPDAGQAVASFKADSKLADIPSDATDLQFAVNVRKRFASSPVQMNRLCKWGTATQQFIMMQLAPGGTAPSISVREFPAETLQIDINSHQGDGHIGPDRVGPMFDELVSEAFLIMSQGYDRLVERHA